MNFPKIPIASGRDLVHLSIFKPMTTAETQLTPMEEVVEPGQGNDCIVVIYSQDIREFGKRYILDGKPIDIGRGTENEITVDSDIVSRRHCLIERNGSFWHIRDLKSTNGTYLNNQLVEEQRLKPGDMLKVGDTIFKYLSGKDIEAQYHETIYRMTIIDALTELYNKRYLLEALDREISRARRYKRPMTLVMLDIDFFKQINDHYGHLAGDTVLEELGRRMRSLFRPDDIIGRYGGEEFLVIMPETSLEEAKGIADAVRLAIEAKTFEFEGQHIKATTSIGLGELKDDHGVTELIKLVDEKLYAAKGAGRNRIIF